jgi:hypothetical protein
MMRLRALKSPLESITKRFQISMSFDSSHVLATPTAADLWQNLFKRGKA